MLRETRNEQGQVIVIVALALIVLLAFAALAIDGGNVYNNKRIAQNAADAAALQGAAKLRELCAANSNRFDVLLASVNEYAQLNAGPLATTSEATPGTAKVTAYFVDTQGNRLYGGLPINAVQAIPCGCTNGQSVGYQATGVEVVVVKGFSTFLAGIFGQGASTATASAKANWGVVIPTSASQFNTSDVYPIAVPSDTYAVGQNVKLFDDTPGPGNFGWVSWRNVNDAVSQNNSLGMGNAPTYAPSPPDTVASYVNPDQGTLDAPLTVGKRVSGGPGLKNGTISQLLGKTVVLPVYDPNPAVTNGQGSQYNYYIVGWVAVELTGYNKQGQQSFMTATVKPWVSPSDWTPSANTCGVPKFTSTKVTH